MGKTEEEKSPSFGTRIISEIFRTWQIEEWRTK
jgi:hypothetical protein